MASPEKFQKIKDVLDQLLTPEQIEAIEQLTKIQKEIKRFDEDEEPPDSLDENENENEFFAQILKMEKKIKQRKQPHYAERDEIIEKIPSFWGMAIYNESFLLDILEKDKDALKYLTKMTVEDYEEPKSGFKINFHFSENPYFENSLLIKEFEMKVDNDYEPLSSQGTTINWKSGKDLTQKSPAPQTGKKRTYNQMEKESFFSYFSSRVEHADDEFNIFDIIRNVIWDNPLDSYMGKNDPFGFDSDDEDGLSGPIGDKRNDNDGEDDEDDKDYEYDEDDDVPPTPPPAL